MASTYKEDGISYCVKQQQANPTSTEVRENPGCGAGYERANTTAGKEFNKTFYLKEMSKAV
jgi:hypothetical protein